MKKAEIISFCDKAEAKEGTHFGFAQGGKNMFFSASYPSSDSRSDIACEKFTEIAMNSFMQRPSVCDEAMREIPQFIARDIFSKQEPDKFFLAHGAAVMISNGKARCILSGKARVLYISDGNILFSSEPRENPLIGARIKYDGTLQPEIELTHSGGIFILCCGEDSTDLKIPASETDDLRKWVSNIADSAEKHITITAVRIPPKESFFSAIFKGKNKNG